jgi:hypothetical protein
LNRYYELAWLARHSREGVNWEFVNERAKEWKLTIPVKRVLLRMEEHFPEILPEGARRGLEDLEAERGEAAAHDWMARHTHDPFFHMLPIRWTLAHLLNEMAYLIESLIPGVEFMRARYGKSRWVGDLYWQRLRNGLTQAGEKQDANS